MLDALCLIHMIKRVREDVKIIANDILTQIKPLEPLFLAVDTFGARFQKIQLIKYIVAWIMKKPLLYFRREKFQDQAQLAFKIQNGKKDS